MEMKFIVFNSPNGCNYAGVDASTNIDRAAFEALLENGGVEAAYVTAGGGHIYVVTADSAEDLQWKVRGNPFFHDSHTRVVPVIDALDFLRGLERERARASAP